MSRRARSRTGPRMRGCSVDQQIGMTSTTHQYHWTASNAARAASGPSRSCPCRARSRRRSCWVGRGLAGDLVRCERLPACARRTRSIRADPHKLADQDAGQPQADKRPPRSTITARQGEDVVQVPASAGGTDEATGPAVIMRSTTAASFRAAKRRSITPKAGAANRSPRRAGLRATPLLLQRRHLAFRLVRVALCHRCGRGPGRRS